MAVVGGEQSLFSFGKPLSISQSLSKTLRVAGVERCNEVLCRIQDSDCEEAHVLGFEDQLWLHFHCLPAM
ncbi:hypothetical protein RIF29_14120 [Crotalaria pallida]|uniref:Uncharacterized protein n=1 Tax=Crotalaria pallida TaxID=3830 RepID=A0AAN9FB64_CROPI